MQILRGDSFEEFGEMVFLAESRFDDNAAGFLAHVHEIFQAKFCGVEEGVGNAYRSVVAPLLNAGVQWR